MIDLLNNLPSPLVAFLAFIITISFLVAIHEYGHFWVARKFGVKIEKFSIGFGKPIVKWHGKRDNTEYSISWIPLGGYVKMYGEQPEADQATSGNITEFDSAEAMLSQKSAPKTLHELIDIDAPDEPITTFDGSFSALPPHKRFLIAFAGPAVNLVFAVLALWVLFMVGVPALQPYVGSISPQSQLYQQLEGGDKIIDINTAKVDSITDATINLVDALGNDNVVIHAVDDNQQRKTATINLSNYTAGNELDIEKALGFQWEITEKSQTLPAVIAEVMPNSPALKAGLQARDKVQAANGKSLLYWKDFTQVIRNNPNKPLSLQVERPNGTIKSLTLTPKPHPKDATIGYAGIKPADTEAFEKYNTLKRYGFFAALPMAVRENYRQAKLTLKTLGRIIIGKASIKNMGGPITIADYSGKTLKMGYLFYFKFLAAISLTLAVMNLLPIPVLDGGHMLLCGIEMVRGRPLSDATAGFLLRIGLAVMLAFMIMVIGVDIWKHILN